MNELSDKIFFQLFGSQSFQREQSTTINCLVIHVIKVETSTWDYTT